MQFAPHPLLHCRKLAGIDSILQTVQSDDASMAACAADPAAGLPWGKFMQSSAVWAVIVAHFCFKCAALCISAWHVAKHFHVLPSVTDTTQHNSRRWAAECFACCIAAMATMFH